LPTWPYNFRKYHSGRSANLIRTLIAQAASKHVLEPRSISFKGAIQTLEAFQPLIALQAGGDAVWWSRSTHQPEDQP
jgi:hypothetical protein